MRAFSRSAYAGFSWSLFNTSTWVAQHFNFFHQRSQDVRIGCFTCTPVPNTIPVLVYTLVSVGWDSLAASSPPATQLCSCRTVVPAPVSPPDSRDVPAATWPMRHGTAPTFEKKKKTRVRARVRKFTHVFNNLRVDEMGTQKRLMRHFESEKPKICDSPTHKQGMGL